MDTLNHTPKSLRVLRGLSRVDVAARAGVSVQTVARIESGRPGQERTTAAVAHVLGVTTGELAAAMARVEGGAR